MEKVETHAQIDSNIEKKARTFFEKSGTDIDTAINTFLTQIVE